ncbi:MAG: chromosomal replication initiator protein DnaA [Oscillospiraceae bacterium]|nr:chromosomal replication initiator protein DnaA [Oscillospiraceae bacterium]
MNSLSDVWKILLERLKQDLSQTTINAWFDEVKVVTMEDSALVLHCSSPFKKEIIEKRFTPQIKDALRDIFSADLEVKILDDEQLEVYHGVRPDHPDVPGENDAFTFETFVVGPQTKMAYAAARSVSEKPAGKFNPLFIYGDSGLGKTHLLHAIARQTKRLRPESKIILVNGEVFTNELIDAIRGGTTSDFRDKYRQKDLLLVDDIQFIAGKQQTQEEFFHTFNALYESGHQIVLTSDRPPKEMTQLEDRLRTRFEWGLMVDVEPPDYETRLAIIRNKAVLLGLNLPDRITTLIAENITANVRQIEGALNKVLAYRDLIGAMDEEAIIDAIRDELKSSSEFVPSEENIAEYIARFFNMDVDTLRGNGQGREVTHARQIAMYLIRRLRGTSLKDIGKYFEGRDHTTVLYSLKQVEKKMRSDPAFAETVKEITTNINAKS